MALHNDDLSFALSQLEEPELRQLLQVVGLRVPAGRVRNARGALVWTRLRTLPAPTAHVAAVLLTSPGLSPLLEVVARGRGDEPSETLHEGVSRLGEKWPPRFLRLVVTVLCEASLLDKGQGEAVLAVLAQLDGTATGAPQEGGKASAGEASAGEASAGEASAGEAADVARLRAVESGQETAGGEAADVARLRAVADEQPAAASTRSPVATRPSTGPAGPRWAELEAPLAQRVLAAGGSATALDSVLVPVVAMAVPGGERRAEMVAAIGELVSMRPSHGGGWFLAGLAEAATDTFGEHDFPPPPNAELDYARSLGTITALVDSGEVSRLADVAQQARSVVERLVASGEGVHLTGPVLSALLEPVPRWVASLLTRVPVPFTGWRTLFAALRRRAAQLVDDGDAVTAEVLLRAADEALGSWAVASDDAGGPGETMPYEAAQLCLLRVRCRRSRRDFAGARRLLEVLPDELLGGADLVAADCERAMVACEVSDLSHLHFPRSPAERHSMLTRLERARDHLDSVLAGDPDNLAARLLSGMRALCSGDDAGATHDLALAGTALVGVPGTEALHRATRFHRALGQLRLLEPGTDESAYRELAGAVADGYQPLPGWLASAAEALEAHGSPLAADAVELAASLAPHDDVVSGMVSTHAAGGHGGLVALARRLGSDEGRSLASRFELLDAALAGAGNLGDRALVEQLVGEIDEVLVRACDATLDGRWAAVLAAHEGVRSVIDPLHADLARIGVLRRIGQIDEARQLASMLFFRVAAGGAPGVDAAELVELVAELGGGDEDLAVLRGMIPKTGQDEASQLLPARDVRVLFVGGDETQQRYQADIDEAVGARYEGRVSVEWFSGWGPNWMKNFTRIEARYSDADAVVLMAFVRTLLGQRVRRTAGEAGLPWISCTGHGRAALERSIDRAVAVVTA